MSTVNNTAWLNVAIREIENIGRIGEQLYLQNFSLCLYFVCVRSGLCRCGGGGKLKLSHKLSSE